MIIQKLKEYLNENGVKYVTITHSPAFTSAEIAAAAHVPGKELAKIVIVTLRSQLAMLVLPAAYHVDFSRLSEALGTGDVYLTTEDEFKDQFPDCEVGAMPPFGNLYDLPVYVSQSLTEDEEIAFNAGTHTDLIRMRYADFARLAKPVVMSFTDRLHPITP